MNLLPALALATLISDDACSARLDHLLVVYREYGLPLPPPDESLVRCECSGNAHLSLGLWSVDDQANLKQQGWSFAVVKPDPVALGTEVEYGDLSFALKCHARGWRPLARAAFRKWHAKPRQRAERQLACDAWYYWHEQISEGAPLSVASKHLKQALPHTGFADEAKVALMSSLDLSLVPTHSAPGSDDALIDELIEDGHLNAWVLNSPAARELARRGFDAIPALIAHLGDERLTRFLVGRGIAVCDGACFMPVKDVVYQLICAFAGKQLEQSNDIAARTLAVGRWFADAQKLGEEKYVVAHVGQGAFADPENVLFPLLVAKYPLRLPEVYRRLLDTERVGESGWPYAKAIVEAPLPLADKLKILEYAATRTDPTHRRVGIESLYRLDPKRANELLIPALDLFGPAATCYEVDLVKVIPETADPKVWAALARAAQRVPSHWRVAMLDGIGASWRRAPDPVCRQFLVAFVASHLTDSEVWKAPAGEVVVRNCAAMRLAQLFGLEFKDNHPTSTRWAQRREQVRHILEHDSRR